MSYDALTSDSHEEYRRFIDGLVKSTVDGLKRAEGEEERQRVVSAYVEKSYAAHLVSQELVDFFCVSNGCVVDQLGAGELEADAVVALFDRVHDDFISRKKQRTH